MWDLIVSFPDHCLSFYFEKLQKMAAKFVTGNYIYMKLGVWLAFPEQLKWESGKKRGDIVDA